MEHEKKTTKQTRYHAATTVRRGHTVEPPSEWNRQTDRRTDGRIATLIYVPYRRAGHKMEYRNG